MNHSQKIWKAKLKEFATVVDNEGVPIDRDILETVVAFNLNGFPTIKSCAGHTQHHPLRFPFVLGWAAGKPESRFTNDKKLRQKIAIKYRGIPEEIKLNPDAAREYYKIVKKRRLHETRQYKVWGKKNRFLQKKIEDLLKQFYSKRKAPLNTKIYLARKTLGCLVMTGEMKIKKKLKNNTVKPSEIPQIQKYIITAQEEMRMFTEFLKNRLFN